MNKSRKLRLYYLVCETTADDRSQPIADYNQVNVSTKRTLGRCREGQTGPLHMEMRLYSSQSKYKQHPLLTKSVSKKGCILSRTVGSYPTPYEPALRARFDGVEPALGLRLV
mmetsp:Transcript_41055/g.162326  ORF Transcript_41055/g.162326 Transcript_41055/m.162326 type:complete len:112 (-) Transcript_41055:2062-2397(-)